MLSEMNIRELSALKLNWSNPANVERYDPYFIWADLTDRAGLLPVGTAARLSIIPSSPAEAPLVRILVEAKLDERGNSQLVDSARERLKIPSHYPRNSQFLTGQLPWQPDPHACETMLTCHGPEGLAGFDLGMAVSFDEPAVIVTSAAASKQASLDPNPSTPLQHRTDRFIPLLAGGALAPPKFVSIKEEKPAAISQPIAPVPKLPALLDGDVIAIIDHGCAFANSKFLVENASRVKFLWDQDDRRGDRYTGQGTVRGVADGSIAPRWQRVWLPDYKNPNKPAAAAVYGAELGSMQIDQLIRDFIDPATGAVREADCYDALVYDVLRASSSHGTHVMDIAAGSPNPLVEGEYDAASKASIIFVQLPRITVADTTGGSMNVFVLDALHYILARTSASANVVVNLSYGTFAGPHDGSSRLERAVDSVVKLAGRRGADAGQRQGNFSVVLPAGNAFLADCHARVRVGPQSGTRQVIRFQLDPDCKIDTFIELWYSGIHNVSVSVKPPGHAVALAAVPSNGVKCWGANSEARQPIITIAHVCKVSDRTPIAQIGAENHMVLITIAPTRIVTSAQAGPGDIKKSVPTRSEAPYGIWEIEVSCPSTDLTVDAWIERDDFVTGELRKGQQARFLAPLQSDAPPEFAYNEAEYPSNQPVSKAVTMNSIATGGRTVAVGAVFQKVPVGTPPSALNHVAFSHYSSSGPGRRDAKPNGPDQVRIGDESAALPGLLAAGNRSGGISRRAGTSVAAPQWTRLVLNRGNLASVAPPPAHPPSPQPAPLESELKRGPTMLGFDARG